MQFNGLDLKIISSEEYEEDLRNISDIPVWIDPISIRIYENKEIIKILLDNEPLAYYVVPFYYKDGKKWAERKYRYFAYLSPFFVKKFPNKKRKEAIYLIFNYIFSNYDYMYMPLHPSFTEISAIQGMGAFMESRHTHVLRNVMNLDELDSKLRNNIKSASKKLKITIDYDQAKFDFDIAIHGTKEEQECRKKNALNLLKHHKAIIFTGYYEGKPIIGNMVTFDNEWVYGLHAWQVDKVPRGSGPYIIYSISKWAFEEKGLKYFDFEGSVMQSIDNYFCNFNAEQIIYPYIHFGKTKKELDELIEISRNIDGRLFK